jgi:hypothetical protein
MGKQFTHGDATPTDDQHASVIACQSHMSGVTLIRKHNGGQTIGRPALHISGQLLRGYDWFH